MTLQRNSIESKSQGTTLDLSILFFSFIYFHLSFFPASSSLLVLLLLPFFLAILLFCLFFFTFIHSFSLLLYSVLCTFLPPFLGPRCKGWHRGLDIDLRVWCHLDGELSQIKPVQKRTLQGGDGPGIFQQRMEKNGSEVTISAFFFYLVNILLKPTDCEIVVTKSNCNCN